LRLCFSHRAKTKTLKTKLSAAISKERKRYPWHARLLIPQGKGKQTVLFAINQGWSYELVPCSDEAILAIDEELGL